MARRMIGSRIRIFVAFACIVLVLGGGCTAPPSADFLAQADEQCRNENWLAATEMLKHYLVHHPDDAGGHFLLGRCYLYLQHLVLAEGEFDTARYYFQQGGRINPIPRFESDPNSADYFEMMTYIEISKVYFQQVHLMLRLNATKESLNERLERWQHALDEARRIRPDSGDIANGQALHDMMVQEVNAAPTAPSGQKPADISTVSR